MPFQCLILIGQVLPKLWPFIYQPMTGHVAAQAWLRRQVHGRPTMTSRAVPVTMGIGALVTVALEWQWSMAANVLASRQGGKLDFNLDFN